MILGIRAWEKTTGVYRQVGEMVCETDESSGRARGAFRYAPEFLGRPDAFAVDPVTLPLGEKQYPVEHPGIFAAFEDSLPDDWGKKLLIRKYDIPRVNQTPAHLLLALGNSGLGALSYSAQEIPGQPATEPAVTDLPVLIKAAELFERGEPVEDREFSMLLNAGSSPGGARPKTLVRDPDSGYQYLAKFPSIKDQVNVVAIEAATLRLAAKAGLTVPENRQMACGSRQVLLVKRFDIAGDGRRRHMISMQTLLKAAGFYQCRYGDLLRIVRKYGADPEGDSRLLFRQMVFNALIGNTDDHLKNFWMTCAPGEGWRLSPAFDLVPDIAHRGEHVLFFDTGPYCPGRAALAKLGKAWGVGKAEKIVDEVAVAVAGWQKVYEECGVPPADIGRFRSIDKKLSS